MKSSASIEQGLPDADVYSDERAKTLLLSLKARLDAEAFNDICCTLSIAGLRLEGVPEHSYTSGYSRLKCDFTVGAVDAFVVNNALERAFEFYDCHLEQVCYDHGIDPEHITIGGQSFHRLVRRHTPRVSVTLALL